jgi:hypothetical protein
MNSPQPKLAGPSKLLLLAVVCSAAALVFVPQAHTQGGNSTNTSFDGDHGDNPVIGSLPIKFVPELDVLFPAVESSVDFSYMGSLPIFALRSTSQLTDDIITADGLPFGGVNSEEDYSILGLVHNGMVVVYRSRLEQGKLDLSQWVTNDFIGGEVVITTNSGRFRQPITTNVVDLPARNIINQSQLIVYADIKILPNQNSQASPVKIVLSSAGRIVTIVYTAQ